MHGFSGTRGLAAFALAAMACQARTPADRGNQTSAPGAPAVGRHLSSEQVSALRAAFEAVPRDVEVELRAFGGDAEAVAFMHDLRRAWPERRGEVSSVVEMSPADYPSTEGVLVCVQEKPGRASETARALHAAMTRGAIPTLDPRICLVLPRRWGGGEKIVLFIGVRVERAR